jgi:hypothetical protein
MLALEAIKDAAIIISDIVWINLTSILGVGGFILGVINIVRSMRSERVKLSVEPALGYITGDQIFSITRGYNLKEYLKCYGLPIITIQVTNLSKFPVTICDVGFSNQHPDRGFRMAILKPANSEELPWPTRLEPRASVTYRTEIPIIDYPFTKKTRAYARTTCGYAVLGDSPAMKFWRTLVADGKKSSVPQ